MIVVKLIGGLGNQLFQYAAGRALADHHATELYLDISFLNKDPNGGYTKRNFELSPFHIKAGIASPEILSQFNSGRVANKLKSLLPGLFSTLIFNESQAKFDPRFFRLPANTYLNGYWQDEEYFLSIREQLLNELVLKNTVSENYVSLLKTISACTSISIHVRRGDYASLPAATNFHGLLSLDYYKHAVEHLNQLNDDPHYFIFSDDIAWCRQNFGFIKQATFVSHENPTLSPQEELVLMSACNQQIIANSSFSWWAAWLNTNPDQQVIAPEYWFAGKRSSDLSILPNHWTIVA